LSAALQSVAAANAPSPMTRLGLGADAVRRIALRFAEQLRNGPYHRVFLQATFVLLGLPAHGQPQLGALSRTARLAVLAHPHAGIALHNSLLEPMRRFIRIEPQLLAGLR